MWASDEDDDLADGAGALPADDTPVVEIRGLTSAFNLPDRRVVIHRNLDFTVRRGEVVSIVGGSGTGKTVLLRQMLGLETPAAGEVRVMGQPVQSLSQRGASSRIGMLFQHGALFSAFTVLENIAFPLRELKTLPHRLVEQAALVKLQMVGLKPSDADKMPSELSGGMIKRAALARALALDPEILFLDEPTSGLDPISAAEFDELVAKMRDTMGLTVYMVTHDLDSLFSVCDRIAVLGNKKVLVEGTVQDMLASEEPWVKSYFRGKRARQLDLEARQ